MSRSGRAGGIPRVLLDGTPLLGQRTGIGRYTEKLLEELAGRPDFELAVTAFTLRGFGDLAASVPPGVSVRGRPFPARVLRKAWQRLDYPRIEWLAGRADVVHGTNFVLPPTKRAAAVVSVYDLVWHTHHHTMRAENQDLDVLVPRALARADAVLTLSEITRSRMAQEFGYPVERIFVAPPGVGPEWFSPPSLTAGQRIALELPEQYFVFVGTREPRKGLDCLLSAYAGLRDQVGHDSPDLVLIGPQGWGTDHAGAAPVGVRLPGYVPQEVLPSVVAASVALVLPSIDEGFGIPAIEAMATGVPVITSDIPVLAEVTGSVGLRFPVGDVDALTARLITLCLEPDDSAPARTQWARQYTWERCADRTQDAYRAALAHRGR